MRRLGEGGMAVVFEALDLATDRRLAMKRMRPPRPERRDLLLALFEREFITLSQLAHPRIVAVHDYGVDDQGPYYTMELLDGGDLARLAPTDYRDACGLARDVCSALSLLHSRRIVYRDLSPSNVRCTSNGLAKLIDFGTLAPMGRHQSLLGTLPCMAPEALNGQPLDARTDLYALGATLYFTLLRRHAYPARSVEELLALWQRRPVLPSELLPGLPPALDVLIGELLELDPALRPSSAGQVMERLTAIAGLLPDEQLEVSYAYLSTPALVGRGAQLATLREQIAGAKQGRGASVLLAAASGTGRSRLLETAALEAKLAGMLVLHADAQRTPQVEYGAVRALARELLLQAPQLAQRCAEPQLGVLGTVIPELLAGRDDVTLETFDNAQQAHRHVQPALRRWLCEVASERALLLTVDDLERTDAPSGAFVALLAREVSAYPILIVAGCEERATAGQGALGTLARASLPLTLRPLTLELTEQLLSSIFGDAPNITATARAIHGVSAGNPRDIMNIARQLVSDGVIAYQSGTWSLPHRLSTDALPASMADALRLRLGRVSPEARALCYALSCEPSWSLSLADCAHLLPEAAPVNLLGTLDELVGHELAVSVAERYRANHGTLYAALADLLSEQQRNAIHARLAELCMARSDAVRAARTCSGSEMTSARSICSWHTRGSR